MVGHTFRGLIQLIGVLTAGLAIMAAIVAWRLSAGPISLSVLTPYLETALSKGAGRYAIELDDTILTWSRSRETLEIRVRGVRATGADGKVVARVPDMSLSLSGAALLRGEIAPRSLVVYGPRVSLVRRLDGGIEFGLGKDSDDAGVFAAAVVAELLAPPAERRVFKDLSEITVVSGDLTVDDLKLETVWRAPVADITLTRDNERLFFRAAIDVQVDAQQATLDVNGQMSLANKAIAFDAEFVDINPWSFSQISPKLHDLGIVNAPVSGSLSVTLGRDFQPQTVDFNLIAEAGRVYVPKPMETTISIRGAEVKGLLDSRLDRLEISNLTVAFDDRGLVHLPAPINHDMPMKSLSLAGAFDGQSGRIDLQRFDADLGGPSAEAVGVARIVGGEATIAASGRLKNVPIDHLARYWPASWGAFPRAWILKNISEGTVPVARADLSGHWAPGKGFKVTSLSGDMDIEGTSVDYLPPMPKARDTYGHAKFDQKTFDIAISHGEGGGVRVTDGRVLFTGLDVVDQRCQVELFIEGPMKAALAMIDHKPLGFAAAVGVSPAGVGGDASIKLDLDFIAERILTLDRIDVSASAVMTDVKVPDVAFGQNLNDGELTLVAEKSGMVVKGNGLIGDLPAKLEWRENFDDNADVRTHYRISTRIDDRHRADVLDLKTAPFTPQFMTGEANTDVDVQIAADGAGTLNAAFDLADMKLNVPGFGWTKPPGVPGHATVKLALQDKKLVGIDQISVDTADMRMRARGELTPGGDVKSFHFDNVKFGRNDLSGTLRSVPNGWEVEIAGKQLDLGPWLERDDDTDEKDDPNQPAMTIAARLDKVFLSKDRFLNSVAGYLSRTGSHWRTMSLLASLGEGRTLAVDLSPHDGKRTLKVASNDAGSTLRTFGLFKDMVGGTLRLSGTIDDSDPDQPLVGTALINNYRVIDAPPLAHVLSIAALTGVLEALSGEGLAFDVLEAPFRYVDGVATVTDARAAGVSLGFTTSGTINTKTDTVDLEGTVVPAYALNSVLGRLPLVGNLFNGGEKGSGVFAANYTMTGSTDAPSVKVNPLSVLTPGFLRRIFGVFDGGAPPPDLSEEYPYLQTN